jgi:hypothetical protein
MALSSWLSSATARARRLRRPVDAQRDLLAQRPPQQIVHRVGQHRDVQRPAVQRLAAREGQQAVGQGRGALARLHGRVQEAIDVADPAFDMRRRTMSMPPRMPVSMLLKSCARPPVSWPTASIFWLWRSWSSSCLRWVMSRPTA